MLYSLIISKGEEYDPKIKTDMTDKWKVIDISEKIFKSYKKGINHLDRQDMEELCF